MKEIIEKLEALEEDKLEEINTYLDEALFEQDYVDTFDHLTGVTSEIIRNVKADEVTFKYNTTTVSVKDIDKDMLEKYIRKYRDKYNMSIQQGYYASVAVVVEGVTENAEIGLFTEAKGFRVEDGLFVFNNAIQRGSPASNIVLKYFNGEVSNEYKFAEQSKYYGTYKGEFEIELDFYW